MEKNSKNQLKFAIYNLSLFCMMNPKNCSDMSFVTYIFPDKEQFVENDSRINIE